MKHEDNWNFYYTLAKQFYEQYHHLNIPYNYEVTVEDQIYKLGVWIINQRSAYNGTISTVLTDNRIEKLNQIGMIWNLHDYHWNFYYELAKQFYEQYHHLNIPYNYEVTIKDQIYKLGAWIINQRSAYSGTVPTMLTNQCIEKLNQIGMIWNLHDYHWDFYYELAKQFYEQYHHLNIPHNYEVTIEDQVYKLGVWIRNQRNVYSGTVSTVLSDKRIEKLNQIGMIWNFYDCHWDFYYELTKQFYEQYHHLNIPYNYEVTIEGQIHKLGVWLYRQRIQYRDGHLLKHRIEQLNQIQKDWDKVIKSTATIITKQTSMKLNHQLNKVLLKFNPDEIFHDIQDVKNVEKAFVKKLK